MMIVNMKIMMKMKMKTDDEDHFFKWYDGYKKRKAQKASIKEVLGVCQKARKKRQKNCGSNMLM